jgi:Fe-S-cluster containining protein
VIHGWDLYRIARDLQLPAESFAELQSADRPDPNYQWVLKAGEQRYHRIVLRKPDGGCVFLLSNGGIGRCGIYASRPGACRAYPAIDDGAPLQLAKREHCPPGAWEGLDDHRFRAHFSFGLRQRLIHDVLGDGWNERVLIRRESRAPHELFGYLIDAYTSLERAVPRWFADDPIDLGEDELRRVISAQLEELGWLSV